jgi:hypothetical protein
VNEIIRVEWFDAEPDERYSIIKKKTFCGIPIRSPGLRISDFSGSCRTELGNTHFVKDGIVYQKPRVIVYLSNNEKETYWFGYVEQAHDFVEKIFPATDNTLLDGHV